MDHLRLICIAVRSFCSAKRLELERMDIERHSHTLGHPDRCRDIEADRNSPVELRYARARSCEEDEHGNVSNGSATNTRVSRRRSTIETDEEILKGKFIRLEF